MTGGDKKKVFSHQSKIRDIENKVFFLYTQEYLFVYLSRIEDPPPKRAADGSIPPTNDFIQNDSELCDLLLYQHKQNLAFP